MTTADKWNLIVSNVQKKLNAKENEVQQLWENIFADANFFGYSRFSDEIDSQRNIHIGSYERTIPDIIIKDSVNNKDLFVLELKQHNLSFDNKYKEQLFSYMKLLRLSVGILICNKIYLYVLDFNDNETSMEIAFKKDNPNGIKFIELFSKSAYSENAIKQFIKTTNELKTHVLEIREDLKSLSIKDVIKSYYADKYSDEEIEIAIKNLQVSILFNSQNQTQTPVTTPLPPKISNGQAYKTRSSKFYNEEFTFTNESTSYRGKNGYKAYNSNGENVGIVFMTDDKRRTSYGYCELCFYPNYQNRYGEWHKFTSHGYRLKWENLCTCLQNQSVYKCYID